MSETHAAPVLFPDLLPLTERGLAAAEAVLIGTDGGPGIFRQAGNIAAETIDPPEDTHASAAFRRDLVRAVVGRALGQAFTR